MESVEMPKFNTPDTLRHALQNLSHNGDPTGLGLWIIENGIQPKPYHISDIDQKTIKHLVEEGMKRIENDLDYKSVLYRWKLLYKSGLLTEDILRSGITNYMNVYMLRSPEAIKIVEHNTGNKLGYYPPKFIEEFKQDLQERIKKELNWNVSI
ncbi:MAG: hypothetical protein V4665_00480 [Patescibacteria group bacterium]